MSVERDKFLTEAMGECWHEYYSYQEPNNLGSMQCRKCRLFTVNNDFSTWQGFGKLWEWAQEQEWWYDLKEHLIFLMPIEDWCHPDRFADALYEFLTNKDRI